MLRMAACLGVPVSVIAPAGFDLSDKALRRAGLDYLRHVAIERHASFEAFCDDMRLRDARLVLLTRHAERAYHDFAFAERDVLLLGRESAGVPETVREAADARVTIPMRPDLRSLNVAVAAAMVLGEALRQTSGFPVR